MRKKQLSIAIIAALAAFGAASCGGSAGGNDGEQAASAITDSGFARQLKVLASDSFQGRKPFTPGEDLTIHYLEQQFKALGLQPGNGSSYFQDVPMVDIFSKPAGALVVKGRNGTVSLNYPDEYVAATRRVQDEVSVNNSTLVFAGFGIVALEYNWNDYAGLDVKGKTVVVMVNDPGFYDTTLFRGKNMTYYGRWTYKFEEAARQGATGLIIIHDTQAASYPWGVIRSGWTGSKLYLQADDNNMSRAVMEGWITTDAAKKLFKLAGQPDSLLQAAGKKGFKPVDLGISTSLVIHNTIKKSTSHNVLAVWPGNEHKDEYIIYSAHWDHLGIGEPVNGDSIYNGAADNGTGTAALLEMAKAFTRLKKKQSRSILFAAVTAEEQGLLGSEYYGTHPVVPVKKTVADINIDVLQPFGKMKDIVVIGYGQSELDDYAQQAAAAQGRVIRKDPDPAAGHYFRSDHFNFAKVGIPALYTENGRQSVTHGEAWGTERIEDYNKNRYHAPGDQFDASWDMSGIVQDARLLFQVGYRLSNETSFPAWKAGSEFKAIREK